jgi:hypothetical protein
MPGKEPKPVDPSETDRCFERGVDDVSHRYFSGRRPDEPVLARSLFSRRDDDLDLRSQPSLKCLCRADDVTTGTPFEHYFMAAGQSV